MQEVTAAQHQRTAEATASLPAANEIRGNAAALSELDNIHALLLTGFSK